MEAGSKAFCGAIHGARAAATSRTTTTTLATIATGEWRKLHATSLSHACQRRVLKPGRGAVGARMLLRRRGRAAQARVDGEIEEIDREVDHDEDERDEHQVGSHHRNVDELHRLHEQ